MKKLIGVSAILILILSAGCREDDEISPGDNDIDLTGIAFDTIGYALPKPFQFPDMDIPADNPLSLEGIELGRRLFYDPILSADSTQSCSSCHKQELAFSDGLAVSTGIDGIAGTRSSMALVNLGYNNNGFFWDGASASLEIQALEPVENPIELHDSWSNVEVKLRRNEDYRTRFRQAFGIEKSSEITKDLATKALSQFMRILVSYQSEYDRALGYVPGIRPILSDEAERGRQLYFTETGSVGEAECIHCHNGQLYTSNAYSNNGLDSVDNADDFADLGLGQITGRNLDKGKFRIPTLRNIALTAPYMHDGRFQTLEEVLDHYDEHLQPSPTLDPLLGARIDGFQLSDQDKADIIAFLHTLTDTAFVNNPAFSNPF